MPTFTARSGSINSLRVTGSLSVSGSVFLESLSPSSSANIVTYDPTTKQLFYSSSVKSAVSSSFMSTLTTNNNQSYYVTFVNNQANQYQQLYIDSNPGITYNPYTNILKVTSSYAFTSSVAVSSSYADSASHSNTLVATLDNSTYSNTPADIFYLDSDGNILGAITVDGVNNASYANSANYAYGLYIADLNTSPGTYYPTLTNLAVQSSVYQTSSLSYNTTTGLLTATSSWAQSASYASSASYALSSSYANNSISSSYAQSASYASNALSSSYAQSASYASNALSSSYALSSSFAVSASYVLSSSYAKSASYATNANYAATSSYSTTLVASLSNTLAPNQKNTIWCLNSDGSLFGSGVGIVINNVESASYAETASYTNTVGFANTAGTANTANTASLAFNSINANTASWAYNLFNISPANNAIAYSRNGVSTFNANFSYYYASQSLVVGTTTNYGQYSLILGAGNDVGSNSIVAGSGNSFFCNNSLLVGDSNSTVTQSQYLLSAGYLNTIKKTPYSLIVGQQNNVDSNGTGYNLILGTSNIVSSSYNTALGSSNEAYGTNLFLVGSGLKSSGTNQTIVGKWNSTSDTTSPFIVGNGTQASNRVNAFTVTTSSSIVVATQSAAPGWTGREGEMVPVKNGANYFIYTYIGGAWRSASLA